MIIEIAITIALVSLAVYLFYRNVIKSSAAGKCSGCSAKNGGMSCCSGCPVEKSAVQKK